MSLLDQLLMVAVGLLFDFQSPRTAAGLRAFWMVPGEAPGAPFLGAETWSAPAEGKAPVITPIAA